MAEEIDKSFLSVAEIRKATSQVMQFTSYLASKGELAGKPEDYKPHIEEAVIVGAKAQFLKLGGKV